MVNWQFASIRARLLVTYLSIILLGFLAITFVAGQQMLVAARVDFENQLVSTAKIMARALQPLVSADQTEESDSEELLQAIANYEAESNYELELIHPERLGGIPPEIIELQPFNTNFFRNSLVLEASSKDGERRLFTGAVIFDLDRLGELPSIEEVQPPNVDTVREDNRSFPTVLVVSASFDELNAVILRRWAVLASIFLIIVTLALVVGVWVARTITQPLFVLRDTAVMLAKGDFSYRVKNIRFDEVGEVAIAFNEMANQVENMLEEQRAFASNASHELRTPLTTIRLRSEALRYEDLDPDLFARYVADIDNEVIRLSALIEDLSLLSRFDSNRVELGESEIDISRFSESLVRQIQPQADTKMIVVKVLADESLPPLRMSLSHLTILFRNLLDNAIKYTPNQGEIHWQWHATEDHIISSVVDTGQGIEAEHLSHVFDRFYRADASHSRNVPGSGLGLTIVQSIIKAYRGNIDIQSQGTNQGTKITIVFPIHS